MKILICEDEEILLTALEFRLSKKGFTTLTAKNGKEALQKIQDEAPDMVVADVMMPYVNGLELIDLVRHEFENSLPIIVMSALEDDDTVLEAFRLGATDFISKPFKPMELVLRIRKIVQDQQQAA